MWISIYDYQGADKHKPERMDEGGIMEIGAVDGSLEPIGAVDGRFFPDATEIIR